MLEGATIVILNQTEVFSNPIIHLTIHAKKVGAKKLPKVLGEWWGAFKRRLVLY